MDPNGQPRAPRCVRCGLREAQRTAPHAGPEACLTALQAAVADGRTELARLLGAVRDIEPDESWEGSVPLAYRVGDIRQARGFFGRWGL